MALCDRGNFRILKRELGYGCCLQEDCFEFDYNLENFFENRISFFSTSDLLNSPV